MRPEEVLHVEFSTQPRGFNQDEVRAHLQQVAIALRDAQELAVEAEGKAHEALTDLQDAVTQLREYEQHGTPGVEDTAQVHLPQEADEALQQRIAQLEAQLREAYARVETAEGKAKHAENAAAEAIESEQLLKRTLVMAQRTADATIAEARAEATRIRTDAAENSEKVRKDADEYAKRTTTDAEEYAARVTREADSAAKQTTEDANTEAERVTTEADEAAKRTRHLADQDAARMRAVASQVRSEAADQARKIADLRRTYAAHARAAIEDHVAAFSALAQLPDLPDELAAEADLYVDSSAKESSGHPQQGEHMATADRQNHSAAVNPDPREGGDDEDTDD